MSGGLALGLFLLPSMLHLSAGVAVSTGVWTPQLQVPARPLIPPQPRGTNMGSQPWEDGLEKGDMGPGSGLECV